MEVHLLFNGRDAHGRQNISRYIELILLSDANREELAMAWQSFLKLKMSVYLIDVKQCKTKF